MKTDRDPYNPITRGYTPMYNMLRPYGANQDGDPTPFFRMVGKVWFGIIPYAFQRNIKL